MSPEVDENGVPWCSEKCLEYDGKRCKLLGFCPCRICEPYVKQMAKYITEVVFKDEHNITLWSSDCSGNA